MATYTTLADLDLNSIARRYDLNVVEVHPLKGGAANSSFRLHTDDGRRYVLTALDNHNPASAADLARTSRTLARLGLPTVHVVPTADGQDLIADAERCFLLKQWIEGEVCDPLPAEHLPAAGELLARLHSLPTNALDLPAGTRRLSGAHRAAITDFPDQDFARWLNGHLATIDRHEAEHRRAPVVTHGDLFADNLIVRPDGTLAIIDWETASLDDPLLDLGMAAVGLARNDEGTLNAERLALLIDGYTRLRPLTAEDHAELPTEIAHAAVIIAFHRYYRHSVRFPDPTRATYHRLMIDFVDSVSDTWSESVS
ncbi:phosphotransferase [Streptomyces sp. NPDC014006]|uniref:phosphotransferase n=1 Tax=Streptomyces sp. NPDC014006 TaxID=3364870 RepID=UPI0036F97475